MQGCGANDFNNAMDNDFKYKELKDQILLPGQTITGVVFAHSNGFNKNFTFTVHNQSNQKPLMLFPNEPIVML